MFNELFLKNNITLLDGAVAGTYRVDVEVEDRLADETATISSQFSVERR